jgi:hypothetical protein
VLGLAYIFLIAKPISIRRLCLLFVLALISATSMLTILHTKHALSHALTIATSVVLIVWGLPLARIMHDTLRLRALPLDALVPVSGAVRWTYGFALVVVPTLTIGCLLNPAHRFALAALPQLMAVAALMGFVFQALFAAWRRRSVRSVHLGCSRD